MGDSMNPLGVVALVLDDNAHMRALLRTVLQGLGVARVIEASGAAEAFEVLRGAPVDVAFVDYRLGDLDGTEFTQLVRTAPDSVNPYLPIVMLTAYGERSKVRAAVDAGVDEFLVKPIRASDVAKRIQAVVNHRRAFVRTPSYFGPDRRRKSDPAYRGPFRRAADKTAKD
jgi:CheY-like chemotaxis protein